MHSTKLSVKKCYNNNNNNNNNSLSLMCWHIDHKANCRTAQEPKKNTQIGTHKRKDMEKR